MTKAFNESQPRDERGSSTGGQWTGSGAAVAAARKAAGLPVAYKQGTPDDLIEGFHKLKQKDPALSAFITVYTKEEYEAKDTKIFMADDGLSGYGIKGDGELVTVFSVERGRGKDLVVDAIMNGADHLDCYEYPATLKLTKLYSEAGFAEVPGTRMNWDDQYMPDTWDKERFDNPDVVVSPLTGLVGERKQR